jgi:ferredoxin
MTSLYEGLLAWGVEPVNIRFEAFGPASIGRPDSNPVATDSPTRTFELVPVNFSKSEVVANWDGSHVTLLEFAEAQGIPVDSGCRAGSCGSCATAIVSGSVKYSTGKQPACGSGECLLCIARPDGPLELGC